MGGKGRGKGRLKRRLNERDKVCLKYECVMLPRFFNICVATFVKGMNEKNYGGELL